MQGINSATARLVYENAIRILQDTNVSLKDAKLTQSYLRLEAQAFINITRYPFPVLNNQVNNAGVIFNTEQRLNQQDSFVAASWGVFVSNPTSNADATAPLQTFGNPIVFPAAGTAAAIETIYNAFFQLAVNNDIVLPAWDTSRHRYVPQTQQTAAFGPGSPFNQVSLDGDGFYPVEPNLVFIGSKNSVLSLQLPAALAAVETFERITVILRGVLAQNSTIIT
jgi:hypothetical protein